MINTNRSIFISAWNLEFQLRLMESSISIFPYWLNLPKNGSPVVSRKQMFVCKTMSTSAYCNWDIMIRLDSRLDKLINWRRFRRSGFRRWLCSGAGVLKYHRHLHVERFYLTSSRGKSEVLRLVSSQGMTIEWTFKDFGKTTFWISESKRMTGIIDLMCHFLYYCFVSKTVVCLPVEDVDFAH